MVITVPRQKWTPESATDEQRRLIHAAIHAFLEGKQWVRVGYLRIREAQAAGVPIEDLAAQVKAADSELKISPATFYRHIGEADTHAEVEPGIVGELGPEDRAVVQRELAAHGWTARDFLLASFAMLRGNPGAYLDRLAQVYERRKRRRSG